LTRKQTTQNRHLRPQKIRGFGLGRTRKKPRIRLRIRNP